MCVCVCVCVRLSLCVYQPVCMHLHTEQCVSVHVCTYVCAMFAAPVCVMPEDIRAVIEWW